jgi:hypothetical protein
MAMRRKQQLAPPFASVLTTIEGSRSRFAKSGTAVEECRSITGSILSRCAVLIFDL